MDPRSVQKIEKTDEDLTKDAMHELPYGIYVIGSTRDGKPNAMIADWVMQVSFSPRLIAVSFERDSSSLQRIRDHGFFTVNLLREQDNGMALAAQFVQPANAAKVKGRSPEAASQHHDKLAGVDYRLAERARGCPILDDALIYLECEAQEFVEAGDHVLVVGQVLHGDVLNSGDPLTSTYTNWTYSG